MNILSGKGTQAQNDVVIANAGMAIYCADPTIDLKKSIEKARLMLNSGEALKSFNKLLNNHE